MKKVIKIILGALLILIGGGAMFLGTYLLSKDFSWSRVGIFIPFFCAGFIVAYLGYDLIMGRSIRDDLFFLFS